ncbi:MAG: CBS domain-containing protein [Deltaproteobacteria bacterium]|nr:CBS domain-containing protein [Deltaproteobacteria bacterium]MBW2386560.1 CBS domain-containing protein [Deltaproteobacteria bacterium]
MSSVRSDVDQSIFGRGEESYFDEETGDRRRVFDVRLLHEPVTVLSTRSPIIMPESATTSDAMRAMQAEHRGCVLVTDDGTPSGMLTGIFTERDILLRVINRGRNPVETPLSEVMSRNPEFLQCDAQVAWVLNMMSVGGFRHVPIVNLRGCPAGVISVRDVVEFLVEAFPNEILNLPPDFGMRERLPRDGA